eukprot:m.149395 g.149395  ORF g.149395 m.149395 type:complete len:87 (-) comp17346_c1_seq2:857-1117(-)
MRAVSCIQTNARPSLLTDASCVRRTVFKKKVVIKAPSAVRIDVRGALEPQEEHDHSRTKEHPEKKQEAKQEEDDEDSLDKLFADVV